MGHVIPYLGSVVRLDTSRMHRFQNSPGFCSLVVVSPSCLGLTVYSARQGIAFAPCRCSLVDYFRLSGSYLVLRQCLGWFVREAPAWIPVNKLIRTYFFRFLCSLSDCNQGTLATDRKSVV